MLFHLEIGKQSDSPRSVSCFSRSSRERYLRGFELRFFMLEFLCFRSCFFLISSISLRSDHRLLQRRAVASITRQLCDPVPTVHPRDSFFALTRNGCDNENADSRRERNSPAFPRIDRSAGRSIFNVHVNARLRAARTDSRDRILAYVTCRVGRFFCRFCNSRVRESGGSHSYAACVAAKGLISNAVMTYPVMARDSFLGSSLCRRAAARIARKLIYRRHQGNSIRILLGRPSFSAYLRIYAREN